MPNFKIAYNATERQAVVQLAADATPTGYTAIGTFTDEDTNTLGSDSRVAYSHVKDALYAQGVEDMRKVKIRLAPQVVEVTPATATVGIGGTVNLSAKVTTPYNAEGVSGVTWASSSPTVATVDANGVVTGAALGSATITATTEFSGKTDTCAITVS